jgi:hypothetical protein
VGSSRGSGERLNQLADDPDSLTRLDLPANVTSLKLTELLATIFRFVRAPVQLDELLSVVADLQGVRDLKADVSVRGGTDFEDRLNETEVPNNFATEVERRSYLRRLWEEITQLPSLQCAALLLNLRDAQEGVISLFPLAGVASVRQIAVAVRMPDEHFAALWNKLPLDDRAIAELLGVTRQQVINLRKSARARLGRRMGARQG